MPGDFMMGGQLSADLAAGLVLSALLGYAGQSTNYPTNERSVFIYDGTWAEVEIPNRIAHQRVRLRIFSATDMAVLDVGGFPDPRAKSAGVRSNNRAVRSLDVGATWLDAAIGDESEEGDPYGGGAPANPHEGFAHISVAAGGRWWGTRERGRYTSDPVTFDTYYSDDRGGTWHLSDSMPGYDVTPPARLITHPTDAGVIAVISGLSYPNTITDSRCIVRITMNNGASWATHGAGTTVASGNNIRVGGDYLMPMGWAFLPSGRIISVNAQVYGSDAGGHDATRFWTSDDYGVTWTLRQTEGDAQAKHILAGVASGKIVTMRVGSTVAADDRPYISSDGGVTYVLAGPSLPVGAYGEVINAKWVSDTLIIGTDYIVGTSPTKFWSLSPVALGSTWVAVAPPPQKYIEWETFDLWTPPAPGPVSVHIADRTGIDYGEGAVILAGTNLVNPVYYNPSIPLDPTAWTRCIGAPVRDDGTWICRDSDQGKFVFGFHDNKIYLGDVTAGVMTATLAAASLDSGDKANYAIWLGDLMGDGYAGCYIVAADNGIYQTTDRFTTIEKVRPATGFPALPAGGHPKMIAASLPQNAPGGSGGSGGAGAPGSPAPVGDPVVPPPPSTGSAASDLISRTIATRGKNLLPHEILLPASIAFYTWGVHGTEDSPNEPGSSGSVNLWLVVERADSKLNTTMNVKINIRRMRGYAFSPSTGLWTLIYDGLPTWMQRCPTPDTSGGYIDISGLKTVEGDGSYSWDDSIFSGGSLHMAGPVPGLVIAGCTAVVSVVEARLLGTGGNIAAALLGMEGGADFRDAAGDGSTIIQSGAGWFGRLTGSWQSFPMLSSSMSDMAFSGHPPPF